MASYIELTSQNFESVTQSGVAVVDFWAPWCGPCRMLSPIIDELAEEYKGKVIIGKVNTDEQDELAHKFGIRSIPTVIFFKDGKKVEQTTGVLPKHELQSKIDSYLK